MSTRLNLDGRLERVLAIRHSVWDNNIQGIPGPIYKWVRINAATEQSLFLQVNAEAAL